MRESFATEDLHLCFLDVRYQGPRMLSRCCCAKYHLVVCCFVDPDLGEPHYISGVRYLADDKQQASNVGKQDVSAVKQAPCQRIPLAVLCGESDLLSVIRAHITSQ